MSVYDCPQAPRAVAADTPPPAQCNQTPGDAAAGRPFLHRGFAMLRGEEWDDDGFFTPEYTAWRPVEGNPRGQELHLSHPRFDFEPTLDWFQREVDRVLGGAA